MTKYRIKRLNQIVDCAVSAGGGGATRKHIATCLGITVTHHLKTMLDQCIAEGYLTATLDDEVYPPVWRYFATEKAVA